MERRIQLKVCGMRDENNIMQVAALHPDYMGFIFFPKSPRFVGMDFKIPSSFPKDIKRVGVFVNESSNVMIDLHQRLKLDFLQLHGHESAEQVRDLHGKGIKVIKVFSVDDSFNFSTTIPYEKHVSFFLFDTKGKYYGGNAMAFNWEKLKEYNQKVPFFLSGGLNEENVKGIDALTGMNLYALDVNSGVEVSPALKDIDKIKAFDKILC
jgi:phosphoribosylanthranilate isomerase